MLTLVFALLIATPVPARPAQFVTDAAGVLDPSVEHALNERLADFERKTSDQVLVYIDKRVPEGTTLEEMGAEAIKTWGIGQKGKDNGAILFIFTMDRKIRIEVGYGLEGALTDAKSKDILSTVVKPQLRLGNFNGAAADGASAILATIKGENYSGSGQTVAETTGQNARGFWLALFPIVGVFVLLLMLPRLLFRGKRN